MWFNEQYRVVSHLEANWRKIDKEGWGLPLLVKCCIKVADASESQTIADEQHIDILYCEKHKSIFGPWTNTPENKRHLDTSLLLKNFFNKQY